ncbi:MAG: hypothetical protein Pg6C_09240 [Treponemataceae bacterium]|nr:MAG: hypothetical protein Pg6C_09240 [Treponemataceae bacterium]
MEVRTTKALFVFIVCLFTVAVFVFAAGVLTQHNSGKKNAQNNFRSIVNATALVFQNESEDAAAVRSGMDAIFAANANLAAITVRLNDILVYAQQMSFGFISMNQNNEPSITLSSPMIIKFSAAFTTRDGKHGIATAAFYTIKQQTVYNMARVSFLIILAATMLAVLFVIANHALRPPRDARYTRNTDRFDSEPAEDEDYPEDEPLEEEPPEEKPRRPAAWREEELRSDTPREPAAWREETTQNAEPPPFVPPAREKAAHTGDIDDGLDAEALLVEIERTAGDPDAQSIISPVTGFIWEAFLESRLEDELGKAVELEQDLALFIIILPELKQNSETAAQIFKLIMDQFSHTDHIFEYKADGVAAIVQNSTSEDSLNQAERLYLRLNNALSPGASNSRLGIGVTNRASRIIPAQRLIKEADEAAHRAFENPETPIVALKIDPAKYRQFLSQTDISANSGTGAYSS